MPKRARYEAANARIGTEELATLDRCRNQLVASVGSGSRGVIEQARPPDAYDDALRVVGLYPLTQIPFSWGVAGWQQSTRDLYATPFPELPVRGQRIRYLPSASGSGPVAGLLPVDGPAMTAARAWQLLEQHAPVLVVDTVDENDRIGRLAWRMSGKDLFIAVDDRMPMAYARVAWTQIGGAVMPQLVYTFWFPARPASHPLDLVAGRLDAVVWRVTLDAEGRPLVYDSIHACGCFHMFFPTERVRERPGPLDHEGPLDETMFAPQVMHTPGPAERVHHLRRRRRSQYPACGGRCAEAGTGHALCAGGRKRPARAGAAGGRRRRHAQHLWTRRAGSGLRAGRALHLLAHGRAVCRPDAAMGAPCDGVHRPSPF